MAAQALLSCIPVSDPELINRFIRSNYLDCNLISQFAEFSPVAKVLCSQQTYRQKLLQLNKLGATVVARDYYRCWGRNIRLTEVNMVNNIIETLKVSRDIEYCQFLVAESHADMHVDNDYHLYVIILEDDNLDMCNLFIDAFGMKYRFVFHDVINELVWRNTAKATQQFRNLIVKFGPEIKSQFFQKTISDKAIAARNMDIVRMVEMM